MRVKIGWQLEKNQLLPWDDIEFSEHLQVAGSSCLVEVVVPQRLNIQHL